MANAGFSTSALQQQMGVTNALASSLQPQPGNTTTAVNLIIVANNNPIGLIRSMRVEENFSQQPVQAIGSAVRVALVPGVYQATASITRAFLFGQSLETVMSATGTIRPVTGTQQTGFDFTQFYFNILEVDHLGNVLATRHDCVLSSVARSYDIDQVIIMEDAQIIIRWSQVNT